MAWYAAEVGRSPGTLKQYRKYVTRFAATCGEPDPFAVTAPLLRVWVEGQGWSASTMQGYRGALRRFYAWAHRTGNMATDPGLFLSVMNPPDASEVTPRPLGSAGPLPWQAPPAWEDALARFRRECRARGHTAETIELRDRLLRNLARAVRPLDPFDLSADHLLDWISERGWSSETRRSARSMLRGFYSWAVDCGYIDFDPAAKLPKVSRKPARPHPASETAITRALSVAPDRERLMIRLAAEIGLRRGEVARVHTRDVLEGPDGWSLLVHGKGGRDRILPLPTTLAAVLRAKPEGWVFPSRYGSHLTAHHVGKIVARWLPPGMSMHSLRHRFATRSYALANDLVAVQELLGHAAPETTRRYVAIGQERLRATVENLARVDLAASAPEACACCHQHHKNGPQAR